MLPLVGYMGVAVLVPTPIHMCGRSRAHMCRFSCAHPRACMRPFLCRAQSVAKLHGTMLEAYRFPRHQNQRESKRNQRKSIEIEGQRWKSTETSGNQTRLKELAHFNIRCTLPQLKAVLCILLGKLQQAHASQSISRGRCFFVADNKAGYFTLI